MDRRLFLTGLLGLTGATLVAGLAAPGKAVAGIPGMSGGILDELDTSPNDTEGGDAGAAPEKVQYRRRRRRPVWRTVCRRVRIRGRWHRRCRRVRVSHRY